MFVAIQRPPGWMRVLPPPAPLVFSRMTATSNEGAVCAKATAVPRTRAGMVLMAQSLLREARRVVTGRREHADHPGAPGRGVRAQLRVRGFDAVSPPHRSF